MLALRRKIPIEGGRDAFALESIGELLAREQAAPIDPGSEICRDRHVGRGGDDAVRDLASLAPKLVEQRAEARLRGHDRLCRRRQLRRSRNAGGFVLAACCRERDAIEELLQLRRLDAQPLKGLPLVAGSNIHRLAQGFHLRRSHQAGMVVLVPGERQGEPLDGVTDETDRLVVLDPAEGLDQRRQIVPRKIGHESRQLLVRPRLDQSRDFPLVADLIEEPFAPDERGVELVRATVDPCAQLVAARLAEGLPQQRTVFEDDHLPAESLKQRFVARPQPLADHRVEALTVVIDDPPAIAQPLLPAFEDGFEDVAFVELGVAHERNHAALGARQPPAMSAHIILHQAGEQRLCDAETDRAGREVDVIGIFGARGVALRTLVAAKIGKLLAALSSEQILYGVIDRARMRLHGYAILRTQRAEIERRHDGGEGSR